MATSRCKLVSGVRLDSEPPRLRREGSRTTSGQAPFNPTVEHYCPQSQIERSRRGFQEIIRTISYEINAKIPHFTSCSSLIFLCDYLTFPFLLLSSSLSSHLYILI